MAEFYSNFSLMSAMIVKVLLVTGIGPGIAAVLVWRRIRERARVRNKARVIEFPGTAGGARPRTARIAN